MNGYPLVIATLMLARGQITLPVVHGPEGAVDPVTYFHELSAHVAVGQNDGLVVDAAFAVLGALGDGEQIRPGG